MVAVSVWKGGREGAEGSKGEHRGSTLFSMLTGYIMQVAHVVAALEEDNKSPTLNLELIIYRPLPTDV